MADTDLHDGERTESPSQRRLDEARRKGQVPRSRDLGAAAVVLSGGIGIYSLAPFLFSRLLALMRDGLTLSRLDLMDAASMLSRLQHALVQGLLGAAPLLGLLLAAALLAPLMIGGWAFSSEALA